MSNYDFHRNSAVFSLGECTYKEACLREGLNKKSYRMYKFRTKIRNTKGMPKSKRYTKTSRIIDLLKFNELPQLINIIKGDMSFVGPRPFIVGEKLPPGTIDPKRYLLKPGATGLAQITHGRFVSHKKKLECDNIYYDNLSFWFDFKIVFNTPNRIVTDLVFYLKSLKSKD
ncbi:MAG: sugar transferase [Bacilli bacterium]|nr:sugar transferase [Bacilli bacterium]